MSDNIPHVYAIQGRVDRDFADCEAELAGVPARLTVLPFVKEGPEVIAAAGGADALIVSSSQVTREVMTALPGLRAVMRTGVGYDVIDVEAATDLGVVVINVPDLWIREVANHAVALLFALNRKVVELDRLVRAGTWSPAIPGPYTGSVYGETLGIVGLGNIGSAFAQRMNGFEMTIIGYDPYVDDAHFASLGVERVSLEELAERADYISVHTLLNDETHHLMGDAVFAHTRPNAVLINTARGPVVDEKALLQALEQGRLAGAALDVWEQEPAAPAHPLLARENVIATSHAAYFSTAAVGKVARRCGEEISRVLRGEQPVNVVNPEVFAPGVQRRGGA